MRLRIVGIGLLNREVVQDQIARFPTYIVATPALTRSVLGDVAISYYGVQLQGGSPLRSEVERRFTATERYFTDFQVASQLEAEAEQSIKPEALALGVFGGIAGLAALLLAIQAIARQLSARDEDLLVLRAIGAGPATTGLDGLIGVVGIDRDRIDRRGRSVRRPLSARAHRTGSPRLSRSWHQRRLDGAWHRLRGAGRRARWSAAR